MLALSECMRSFSGLASRASSLLCDGMGSGVVTSRCGWLGRLFKCAGLRGKLGAGAGSQLRRDPSPGREESGELFDWPVSSTGSRQRRAAAPPCCDSRAPTK